MKKVTVNSKSKKNNLNKLKCFSTHDEKFSCKKKTVRAYLTPTLRF